MENNVVKLGVVGLKRGAYVAWTLIGDKNVVIRAIADSYPEALRLCKEDYEKMVSRIFFALIALRSFKK